MADEQMFLCEPSATGGVDYYSEEGWQGRLHPIHSQDGGIEKARYSVKLGESGGTWKRLEWDSSDKLTPYGEDSFKQGVFFGVTTFGRFEFNPNRLQFTYTHLGRAIVSEMTSDYSNLPTLYVQIGKCFRL